MLRSKIRAYMELNNVTRKQIRDVLQVSENTLSNWNTGKSFPPLEKAFKLSRLLGVTVEELYEYKEDDK
jgi:putative transcriptional regulator